MEPSLSPEENRPAGHDALFWRVTGGILLAGCAAIEALSWFFRYGEGHAERPVAVVTAILLALGAVWVVASLRAIRRPPALRTALVFALTFRAVLLPSRPVQEDDIYRYLWDGRVVASGHDPYLHSPREVLEAPPAGPDDEGSLAALARLRDTHRPVRETLERVNHPDRVTIYPPPVQAVFAAVMALVPRSLPIDFQVGAMKLALGLFEAGALLLLLDLLRRTGRPLGWVVIAAWCPLPLKEVWNSGHMDAVPAFLLALALRWCLVARSKPLALEPEAPAPSGFGEHLAALLAGVALAATVASKLWAVVAVPLVFRWLRFVKGSLFLLGGLIVLVVIGEAWPQSIERRSETVIEYALSWEMNAAFFYWIERLCALFVGEARWTLPIEGWSVTASPTLARIVAAASVLAVVTVLTVRTRFDTSPQRLLGRVFVAQAVAFVLGPVGFPWFLVQIVPLLPFAPRRAWLLLPAVLPVYYLRFAFAYHPATFGFDHAASAHTVFDSVVVTAEYLVFAVPLALESGRSWWAGGGRAGAGG